VILLLYVDDILLTGSHSSLLTSVIDALTQEFDMKDLGQLTYFLGLQVSYSSSGLFVSQSKYIKELLDRVDLQNSKSCATPCLPYHHLLKDDGKPYSRPQQYKSIVGALQYLTFTLPDIAFSVNQACQFMHNLMESHVVAVKRILRNLRGTLDYGIHFQPGTLNLQAYNDVDWAGMIIVLFLVLLFTWDPILFCGLLRSNILSHARLLRLNIGLLLLLLPSSHGFVNCSVICMFHCLFLL
jgi:hypothetical protein